MLSIRGLGTPDRSNGRIWHRPAQAFVSLLQRALSLIAAVRIRSQRRDRWHGDMMSPFLNQAHFEGAMIHPALQEAHALIDKGQTEDALELLERLTQRYSHVWSSTWGLPAV